jgi:DNA ligase-1
MQLSRLVQASARATETRSKRAKVQILAEALRELAPVEIEAGVGFLSGELRQGRIGVGGARAWALREVPAAAEPSLEVADVDGVFERLSRVSGKGSNTERDRELGALFSRATHDEQQFLVRLLVGELRQGALEGLMSDAIAQAAELEGARVRRAAMLSGNLREVARRALTEGAAGLADYRIQVFRPIGPMLASTSESLEGTLSELGEVAIEDKLDGARVQVHKEGAEVRVFTRNLNEVTERVPEVVELVRTLPARRAILDGEAIALAASGRPEPFQVTMSRFGRRVGGAELRDQLPLSSFYFDALLVDDTELIDRPNRERVESLRGLLDAEHLVRRIVTASEEEARAFVAESLARGHEGSMLKSPASTYEAGRRGASWLKLKPAHTLDLVVLAVERGNGRRSGFLSNLHLGARDPKTGTFVMLGKTFKGMTDAMLSWQTEHLGKLKTHDDGYTVHVRPELVVEIAFDGLQKSSTYPGGLALRFARVKRYRTDKSALDADTIDTVRGLYAASPEREGSEE